MAAASFYYILIVLTLPVLQCFEWIRTPGTVNTLEGQMKATLWWKFALGPGEAVSSIRWRKGPYDAEVDVAAFDVAFKARPPYEVTPSSPLASMTNSSASITILLNGTGTAGNYSVRVNLNTSTYHTNEDCQIITIVEVPACGSGCMAGVAIGVIVLCVLVVVVVCHKRINSKWRRWRTTKVLRSPTNLRSTNKTASSLDLAWDAPSQPSKVDHYTYKLSRQGESDRSGKPAETSATVKHLTPGATYTLAVTAVKHGVDSAAVTKDFTMAPRSPTNLRTTNKTSSSLGLAWDAPSQPSKVDHYAYKVTGEGEPDRSGTVNEASAAMNHLTPGANYTASVQAVEDGVSGNPIKKAFTMAPRPPTNFVSTDKTSSTLDLAWDAPSQPSKVDHYTYEVSRQGESDRSGKQNETSATVPHLTPGATYAVSIRAVKEGVSSDPVTEHFTMEERHLDIQDMTQEAEKMDGGPDVAVDMNFMESQELLGESPHVAIEMSSVEHDLQISPAVIRVSKKTIEAFIPSMESSDHPWKKVASVPRPVAKAGWDQMTCAGDPGGQKIHLVFTKSTPWTVYSLDTSTQKCTWGKCTVKKSEGCGRTAEVASCCTERMVYVTGGGESSTQCMSLTPRQGVVDDPSLSHMTIGRKNHAMSALKSHVYVCGGEYDGAYLSDCERYSEGAWQPQQRMSVPRAYHGLVEAGGRLYAIGGKTIDGKITASVEYYTPGDGADWKDGPPIPQPLWRVGCVTVGNSIWVVEGMIDDGTPLPHAWEYRLDTNGSGEWKEHSDILTTGRPQDTLVVGGSVQPSTSVKQQACPCCV